MRRINKLTIVAFFIIAILFLVTIPILRYSSGNPYISGASTYQYLQQAQVPQTLFDHIVNFIASNFSFFFVSVVFPLIIGFVSLVLIALLLKFFVNSNQEYYYALGIIVLSPLFLVAHVGLHVYSLIFMFGLLTTYLYIKRNPFYLLTLGLLFAFDSFLGILAGLFLFLAEWIHGEKKKSFIVALSLVLISSVFTFLSIHTPLLVPEFISINSLFLFFGGKFGYSLFIILLGIVGMSLPVEFTTTTTRLIQLVILLLSVFYEPLRLFGMFLLAIYSAIAFHNLMNRKWSVEFIGNLTIILLFCILIFSTSTFLKETYNESPTIEQIVGLKYLGNLGGEVVFAHPSTNYYVHYFSGLDTFDDYSLFFELSTSRTYTKIKKEFIEKNVTYVFIDSEMYSLWHKSEEGLLFIMENNDDFRKIYDRGVVIYLFYPSD